MHLSPESVPLMHTLINYSPWTILFLALSPRLSSSLFYSLHLFLILNCDYHGNNPSNCGSVLLFFCYTSCLLHRADKGCSLVRKRLELMRGSLRLCGSQLFYTQRDKPLPSSFGIIIWQLIMGVNQFDLILNLKSHWFYLFFFSTEFIGIKSLSLFDPEFILFF